MLTRLQRMADQLRLQVSVSRTKAQNRLSVTALQIDTLQRELLGVENELADVSQIINRENEHPELIVRAMEPQVHRVLPPPLHLAFSYRLCLAACQPAARSRGRAQGSGDAVRS